jgi:hypothetical protein
MRLYLLAAQDKFVALAPEVPGSGLTGHEARSTREEALDRCRAFVKGELAAYERLGVPLAIDPREEVVEWVGPASSIPELLTPMRPAELRAAVARMDDLAAEVDRAVAGVPAPDLERHAPGEWSARTVLDHIAHAFVLAPMNLDPFALDRVEAHSAELARLAGRLQACVGRADVFIQFGTNSEGVRVRWTPRKVARVVRTMQDAWTRSALEGGAPPRFPSGHEDLPEDDAPLTADDVASLRERDARLRSAIAREPRAGGIAYWYRYYATRLVSWPEEPLMRWRAMYTAFRERIASADETDLALVRLSPLGVPSTIRGELRLPIGHVVGHLDQIRAATAVAG